MIKQLDHLTSLRFFAATAVLFSHLAPLQNVSNPIQQLAQIYFHEGYIGVSFFFILSGFILSHSYEGKIKSKSLSVHKYLLLRLARLYPLHILIAIAYLANDILSRNNINIYQILSNFLLLQSWNSDPSFHFSLNSVSWSISNEMFFYLSFIVFIFIKISTMIKILCVLTAGTIGSLIYFTALKNQPIAAWDLHYYFYIFPPVRCIEFIFGIIIYHFSQNNYSTKNSTFHELSSLVLLFFVIYLAYFFKIDMIWRYQMYYLPFMLYLFWAYAPGKGQISKLLKNDFFILLGNSSFALYLSHRIFTDHGFRLIEKFMITQNIVVQAIIIIITAAIASIIIYKFIEYPIHNRLKKMIGNLQ